MAHGLVLRGRLIQEDGSLAQGAIGIDPETGKITSVASELQGEREVDYGTLVLLPGGVDIHVHFRDPGHPHKEDFASGTLSALHGGVTTVADMPNTDPATTTLAAYQAKRALVGPKAHVDWALYGGVTRPGPELRALAAVAPAIKIYLGESTGCVTLEDASMLPEVLTDLVDANFRGVVAFHAEAASVLHEAGAVHADAEGLVGHEQRRPIHAEEVAFDQIRDALSGHAKKHGPVPFRVHIAHASSHILHKRARGAQLSHGITPNHLLLHNQMDLDAHGRLNPPLRAPEEQHALFAALAAGRVPIIESDHAPHTIAEKDHPVRTAPSGIPGVETMMPLFVAHAAAGHLPLSTVVHACCTGPAALFGIPKGQLRPGFDADITVWNLDDVVPIEAKRLHSRAGWSPFEGHAAVFPRDVYLRGRLALEDGTLHVEPGAGQPLNFPVIAPKTSTTQAGALGPPEA